MSNDSLAHLDDLEIYIGCTDVDAITQWLQTTLPCFELTRQSKKGCKFRCGQNTLTNNGMVVLNAGRTGFTSVWIDSKDTPWNNDVAMGRAAFEALQSPVRCVESAWSKGDDPDQWLEISAQGENIIQWVTEEP
jgi:hypothetical protein